MLVRITAGAIGIGQVIDLAPVIARARIAAGTAVEVLPASASETAMFEPGERGEGLRRAAVPPPETPKSKLPKFLKREKKR